MRFFSTLILILLFSQFVHGQTETRTFVSPSSVSIDDEGNYGQALLPVTFETGAFNGCVISDVDVTINWAKTDGSCTAPDGGCSFYSETSFRINSPTNNTVLALPGTWNGCTTTSSVVTTFDQGASGTPSGIPTSGDFLPNGGNLNTFNGTSPYGDWRLYAGDNGDGDPLCVKSYSVEVTVTPDVTAPTIAAVSNINVNTTAGQCFGTATWSAPAISDACGASIVQTGGPSSGSNFAVGSTTITYTATDNFGNSSTRSFNVIVTDNEPPQASCPANQTAIAANGSCSANVSYPTPTASDNCSATIAHLSGGTSGSSFPVGPTTVTWRATDAAGLTDDCSFTVTVVDNQPPSITCPSDISLNTGSTNCFAVATFSDPTTSDNCPGETVTLTSTLGSGSQFPVGSTPVSFQVEDASGLTNSCSFNVIVTDNQNPTITNCPDDIVVDNDPGECDAVVTWTAPTVTDNCAVGTTLSGPASGSTFNVGLPITTITYTALDANNNSSTCSFTVTVNDTEDPVITCPPAITASNDAGTCGAVLSPIATATDNCNSVTTTQIAGPTSGGSFPVGTSTVTFRATDSAGNSADCSVSVTVNDTEAPQFLNCDTDTVEAFNDAGLCEAVVDWPNLIANDNCPGWGLVTLQSSLGDGDAFPVGVTNVVYSVTDAHSNTTNCEFPVKVIDNEFPVVTCPASQVTTFPGCEYTVNDETVGAGTDNCPGLVVTQNPPPGVINTETDITLTAVDASGNTSSCVFTIAPLDDTTPTFDDCPTEPDSISVNNSCQFVMLDYSDLDVSDVCNPTLTFSQSPAPGSIQSSATQVTVTVSDGTNDTTCVFGVVPRDEIGPSITCPAGFDVPADANCQFQLPDYTGLATGLNDNCPGAPTVSQPSIGDVITGSASVELIARDAVGNETSCSFTVTVDDDTPPVASCPAGTTVYYNANCVYSMANFVPQASATDNCPGTPSLLQTPSPGTSISGSSAEVTITATDAAGNQDTCVFTLAVADTSAPSIACPTTQSVDVNSSCEYALADFTGDAITSDNCSAVTVTQDITPGTVYDFTVNPTVTVTLTATDVAVNTKSCSFDVLLNDVTPPTITCGPDVAVLFDPNCTVVVGPRTANVATLNDNCDSSPIVTQSPASNVVVQGQTTIRLTATDASGNSEDCEFELIPSDSQAPTIDVCPTAPIEIDLDANCNYTLIDYTGEASFTDNCDLSLTVVQSPGFGTVIGTQASSTVTITATDDAGNSNVCSITITPVDNTPPTIDCPADVSVDVDADCEFELINYAPFALTDDNCDASVAVSQLAPNTPGTIVTGNTVVTLRALDDEGNITECTFNVLPADNTPPTINCPIDQPVPFNASCQFNIVDFTGLATGIDDNCDDVSDILITQSVSVGSSIGDTTQITLTATDLNGNASTCTFDVNPSDNTNPTITCPSDVTLSADLNCEYDLADYTGQALTDDNCDASVDVSQSPLPSTGIDATVVTTVTLTATDEAGNASSCDFEVSAEDDTAPSITCPTDTVVSTDASCQYVMIDETANHELIVSDNCDSSPTISQAPAAGVTLTATTVVTLSALDSEGNSGSCTYTFTLEDQVAPTITCPGDQLISSNASCVHEIPDFTNSALVNDNCTGALMVTQSPQPIINSIAVDTVITLTVTDGNGNSADCDFLITADDGILPNITCPGDQLVSFDSNCIYELDDYIPLATASDNCGSVTVTQLQAEGTPISGSTPIVLVATDADLNTDTCTFNVIPSDLEAPTVTCLQPTITVTTGGQCSFQLPDYTGAAFVTASDNCPVGSFTYSQSPVAGSLIGGSTVVTISTIDGSGNIGSCQMTVTPEDDTPPSLVCPADATVSLDANCEYDILDYTGLVFVSDNCDTPPFAVVQYPSPDSTITGENVITVELSVTDGASNMGSCTLTVTTIDDEAPSITCPADVVVPANSDCEFALSDYTGDATSSDNCTASPALVQSPASGNYSGNVAVTITATDDAGNTNSCSFNVTPEDNTAPNLTCPPDQTPNFSASCEFTLIDYTGLATFSDFCDNTPFITQSPGIGTIVSDATPVTITVVDDAGNDSTCTFQILPNDVTAPEIDCPADFEVSLSGSCDYMISDYEPLLTVSDNCDPAPTVLQTPSSGSVIGAGTVALINMTATDASLNSASCSFSITLVDDTAPVLTNCPPDQTVPLSANCQFIVDNYTGNPTVDDNCDATPVVSQSPLAGSLIGGATLVTLTALDASGNEGTCSFTVTPEDVDAPTIFDCPSDIVQPNDEGICGAVVSYPTITALDNCAGVVVLSLDQGQLSGSTFPIDTTQVVWIADDGNGNTTNCEFEVVVTDSENPIIICPVDFSANVDAGTCGASLTYALPTVTDNCTDSIVPTLESGLASGSILPEGINTVVFEAEDEYGNTSSCSFEITVVDNEDPVITCPASITTGNDPGQCSAVVTYDLPTVTDNCTEPIIPTLTLGLLSGETFPFGVTTIRYLAEDASGNTSLCSFSVTVNDEEQPILTCPNDTLINCDATVEYDDATGTDNCATMVVISELPNNGFVFGDNTVTFEGDDGNGNTSFCDFTVTIQDTVAPTIDICPSDQFESFDASCNLNMPDYTGLASSTDNCDGNPVISQSPQAGVVISGTTTVTLSAVDFAGNSSSCTFTVTDDTPPVVQCPVDQNVGSDINCQYELLDYAFLTTSSDNCGATTLTQMPEEGTLIDIQTTITITAEDEFGNTSTCEFEVIPSDNIPPSITCIGNQTVLFDSDCQVALADYTGQALGDDNCDLSLDITQSPEPGTLILGSTEVTFTATDDGQNSTSCSFMVNPIDVVAPTILCPSSQTADFDANCTFTLDDYTGLATTDDNCVANVIVTQTPSIGSSQSLNTIVTLIADDGNGNTATCLFVVVPEDNIDPQIDCPSDLEVDFDVNCEYSLIDYTNLGIPSDNCSSQFVVNQTPAAGTIVNVTTNVELTVIDESGNSSTCSFDVIPEDNTPPTVACAADIIVPFDENCEFELGDYNGFATTDDNCSSIITVTQQPASGTIVNSTESVTLTATDEQGNQASCSFSVQPEDADPPTITCPDDQEVSLNSGCLYAVLDYTGLAVVDDNCSSTISVTQDVLPGITIVSDLEIELTANDGNGNQATCSFTVIPSDNTTPDLNCPSTVDVALDENCEYYIEDFTAFVGVFDNCGAVSLSQLPTVGTLETSSTFVEITATDGSGNNASCEILIEVADTTNPSLECPVNQVGMLDANCQFELADYAALATLEENCGLITNNAVQFPPAGTVVVANTLITLSATDGSGNENQCQFNVFVEDNIDPTIDQCPQGETIQLGADCSIALPDYTVSLSADDNCDANIEFAQIPLPGVVYSEPGVLEVDVAAIDNEGNFALCEFEVELVDLTAPTIQCPADQMVELSSSCNHVIPDYTSAAIAADACGSVNVTQSPVAGSVITGLVNATLIAEDENGNTATCTFFVDVIEYEIEVTGTDVSCENGDDGTATVSISGGEAPYAEDWGGFDPNALDPGFYTVTVTDANGCQVVGDVTIGEGGAFEIDINPSGEVVICQGSSITIDAGSGYADYDWSTGASVQMITVTNEGDYWVTVTNAQGCVSNTDTVSVSFYSSQIPDVIVEANESLSCSNDTASTYQWYLNGSPIPNATDPTYCPLQSGNYYVVITDSYGCTVSSSVEEYTFSDSSPCATSINEYGLKMDIYPNPSNGVFTVSYSLDHQAQLQLTVIDMMGRQITNEVVLTAISGNQLLDLSQEANGVFILRIVKDGEHLLEQRLMLVK